ncbi:PREDICTED: ghrelin O-acyltransferase [Cariama cristata]|nr:PREDICTED: ghrelin O-acyltransferase [Cariama cristata]
MCWADLLVLLPAAPYRLAAFPFAALFHHLCALGHLSLTARYIFLLTGGCLLAGTAMGRYAVLLLIPAAGSVLTLLSVSPARAHVWVFALQMSWQTVCHLGLSSQELDPRDARPAIALSAIMLLAQKATSLALDYWSTGNQSTGRGTAVRWLAYYLHWVLDEALLEVAGFVPEAGQGDLSVRDLWTLETTHRMAVFARTWNKSTSRWLRRLIFQRCPARPLLATSLRPGQVFGFLCWAVMVEADYRIHPFLSTWAASQGVKLLYRGTTWVFTQLIVAYILVAVETESFSVLCLLWTSCNSILPLSYGLTLLLLAKKPKQN